MSNSLPLYNSGVYYYKEDGENIGGKLEFFATNILLYFHSEVLEVLKRMGSIGGKEWWKRKENL